MLFVFLGLSVVLAINLKKQPVTKPVRVGSGSEQSQAITKTVDSNNIVTSIVIDFSKCEAGGDSLSCGFGSTHFLFEGAKEGKCLFHYGTEIENPNWDGVLNHICMVPAGLGKKTFEVDTNGIKMEYLNDYCTMLR